MRTRAIYCAQAYVRRGGRLTLGMRYDFDCAVDAETAGRDLSRVVDGVIVFGQEGSAEFDVWTDPEIYARHGETPLVEF
jgi:hypothetical protein